MKATKTTGNTPEEKKPKKYKGVLAKRNIKLQFV